MLISCDGKPANKTENTKTSQKESSTKQEDMSSKKTIVFFGDSLTAGFGLDNPNDAFPGLIQKTIDSLHLPYTVVNSGVSGETTAGGLGRINWVLNQKPDVFILELGANDGLRGVPLTATRENLQAIVDAVATKYPETRIVLAGMQIPPNMGPEYTRDFRSIFPDLAKKNNLALIPFLLENVGGVPSLNQADGIHPTEKGHQIVAENVWPILEPLLVN